jgi:hypothetical protein
MAIKRLQWAIREMSVWKSEDLLEFVGGLMALYQQTREELVGEVEFAIGSVPPKSLCFQASQSTKSSSLASTSPKLVSNWNLFWEPWWKYLKRKYRSRKGGMLRT